MSLAGKKAIVLVDQLYQELEVWVRRHKPEESRECKSRTSEGLASQLGLE